VPLAWFVPFAGAERWIALGHGSRGQHGVEVRAPAQVARTLVYVTAMSRARRRVAGGLAALRGLRRLQESSAPGADAELAGVGRWLERFHPYSLVELDYGGLVHLLSDDELRGDESVAEIGAAIDGMSRGHCELARAMYGRAQERWRMFREFEQVN
jgi:glycine cleavage system aminomethyltransferase T